MERWRAPEDGTELLKTVGEDGWIQGEGQGKRSLLAGWKLCPRTVRRGWARCTRGHSRSRGLTTRTSMVYRNEGRSSRGPRGLGEEVENALSRKYIWKAF